jgi:putative flippase GtrA
MAKAGRFAAVGLGATLLHVATALGAYGGLGLTALRANLLALAVALTFNFFANWRWTFDGRGQLASAAPKFMLLQAASLALNQTIVYLCTVRAALPLWVALVLVVVLLPPLNFCFNRTLVFKTGRLA